MSDSATETTVQAKPKRSRRPTQRIAMISTHGYVAAEPPLGAPDTGGQVVYVIELSRKLAQLGYKVDIWTRQFEGQAAREEVDKGVRILRVPCGGTEFIPKEILHRNIPEFCDKALRLIHQKKLRYSFINSHYWDAGIAGESLSKALKVPHLHTPHSIGSWKKRQMQEDMPGDEKEMDALFNFSNRIRNELAIYRGCDMLIATSPPQLDLFKSDYDIPSSKIRMIPPGYDDNRFFPVSEATRQSIRHNLGMQGKVITSIGRLARNKGFDLLVDAFTVVKERIPDAHLRLAVGTQSSDAGIDTALQDLHEHIDALGLRSSVTVTGSLSDEELADFYRASDLFALSSRYEPFGMTAIEAMACGAPTVMTIHGGLFRTVSFGNDALYADTFDREDFGITLVKPLRHPVLARRLSVNGSLKVRSLFTWTGIAQQLIHAVEGGTLSPLEIDGEPV
jgi:mannosylfructose-phosphate synthase